MEAISKELSDYYLKNLKDFGTGPKGVGWKSDEAQKIRFTQLVKVFRDTSSFSVNDLGCGVGDLVDYLNANHYLNYSYRGYDVIDKMISIASENHSGKEYVRFELVNGAENLKAADYTLASGIFNLKYLSTEHEWISYILKTLYFIDRSSIKGFSFNMLTKYSDKEYMQDHLYYADPLFFFDYCKRNYSRNVALLHDYNEYDFTIIVKKW